MPTSTANCSAAVLSSCDWPLSSSAAEADSMAVAALDCVTLSNRSRTGDGYWVFAHVTPSFDRQGKITGYHSNRRVPYADALTKVRSLYAQLRAEEQRHSSLDAGIKASTALLTSTLEQSGLTYAQFVFGLSAHTCLARSIA